MLKLNGINQNNFTTCEQKWQDDKSLSVTQKGKILLGVYQYNFNVTDQNLLERNFNKIRQL